MGASQSSSGSGLQIGRVAENSPARLAGLVPFFDFVRAINGHQLTDSSGSAFKQLVAGQVNKEVKLDVWNGRTRSSRAVTIVPRTGWGGNGLLGCSVYWRSVDEAMGLVYRVIEVQSGSAAARSGLLAMRDYIIGMQIVAPDTPRDVVVLNIFLTASDFHQRLQAREESASLAGTPWYGDKSILLLVYDSVANDVREVSCEVPLGCDVATGYLHAIPTIPCNIVPTIRFLNRSASPTSVSGSPPSHPLKQTPKPHHATHMASPCIPTIPVMAPFPSTTPHINASHPRQRGDSHGQPHHTAAAQRADFARLIVPVPQRAVAVAVP
jgi:hypothetical protein